jgi:predicted Zn-dependent protease
MMQFLGNLLTRVAIWWRGRQYRLLWPALPAVVIAGTCACLAASAALVSEREQASSYHERGAAALKARDYAVALTCYDRLARGSGRRPEVLYGLAVAAEGVGQSERAQALMNELAPPDQPGYAPAHFWQARRLLPEALKSAEARQQARAHLLLALDGEIDEPDLAHGLLCELYLIDRQLDLAEPHLLRAVKARPQLRLRAAQLYWLRGDKDRARREAELAVDHFRAAARADRSDHGACARWAEALTFLERFSEAVEVLEEGWAVTRAPALRTALGDTYATWHDTLAREPGDTLARRLELLQKGLHSDPANVLLLNRLLALTRLEGADADRARAALRALLAQGQAPAAAHFALSVDALRHDRPSEARVHLEQAMRLAPELPIIANNLAWLLAHDEAPDLPRALTLAQVAVERAPGNASFRHTRGVILAKMARWKEALADLEAFLPQQPDDPGLHRLLATAYENLGAPEMAAEHRRQADRKPPAKPPAGTPR